MNVWDSMHRCPPRLPLPLRLRLLCPLWPVTLSPMSSRIQRRTGDPSASAFSTLQHVTPRQLPPRALVAAPSHYYPLTAVASSRACAVFGVCLSWEHVRASPSPPPVAVTTTTDNNDVLSGPGMFDKASERLRELSSTVGSKIEQFAASHKDFQKQNATPNQRTPVVSDAEKEYYGAKESSERAARKDQDRLYEASMI